MTRHTLSFPNPDGSREVVEIYLAKCERCGFSATSRVEAEARAVVDRHGAKCAAAAPPAAPGSLHSGADERRKSWLRFLKRFDI